MLWTERGRLNGSFDPWIEAGWLTDPVERLLTAPSVRTSEFPLVNIWINGDDAVLATEIPGIDPASVEISVAGKTVTIRGARETKAENAETAYQRRERWRGRFSKTIELPFNLEADAVEARFRKGVLQVTLPKAHADKPKTIKVKSA